MDKVYKVYKESLLNPTRLLDDLNSSGLPPPPDDNSLDALGMGIVRKEVDLTNEEKQYLLAVERGDIPSTRQILAGLHAHHSSSSININCVDPLGRTALLVAIENENIDMIEILLHHNVEIGDALLHAISEENVEAVELLLNHQVNTKGEELSVCPALVRIVCHPSLAWFPQVIPVSVIVIVVI
ncbi:hypothetical protein ACOMHN_029877 [Nucella lapillus]